LVGEICHQPDLTSTYKCVKDSTLSQLSTVRQTQVEDMLSGGQYCNTLHTTDCNTYFTSHTRCYFKRCAYIYVYHYFKNCKTTIKQKDACPLLLPLNASVLNRIACTILLANTRETHRTTQTNFVRDCLTKVNIHFYTPPP